MWFRILALPVCLLAVGCGGGDSPRQSIYGNVTLDGEPLAKGTIRFAPQEGTKGPSVGGIIEDGEYELDSGEGPVPGDYRVQINSPKKGDKPVVVIPGEEPGYDSVETIPPQYNIKSTLTVTVSEGDNEKDFPLVSTSQ